MAQVGERVWLPDPEEVWVGGVVEGRSVNKKNGEVELSVRFDENPSVLESVFFDSEQELASSVKRKNDGPTHRVEDLIRLPHLHEAAILEVLQGRARSGLIYTNVGAILLAVNPFKRIQSLYSEDAVALHRTTGAARDANPDSAVPAPPHAFAVADSAYRAMRRAQIDTRGQQIADQAILISGESGAGKTESTKVVMRYLAGLSANKASQNKGEATDLAAPLESRVLQTNPILEGFGNARTLRNDNSSRFGKWISLEFDGRGRLRAAALRTYLLEKVRLVRQAEGERGFHIFYESLAGDLIRNEEESVCVSGSSCGVDGRLDGVRDVDELQERLEAIEAFGVAEDDLFQTLAAVLALGSLEFTAFEASAVEDAGSKVSEDSMHVLRVAANALGLDANALERALTVRSVLAEGEVVQINLSAEAARRGRDALLKAVYSSLFDYLVAHCNERLANNVEEETLSKRRKQVVHHESEDASIGLLDIFGFEVFQVNSFEQLLINFTNERLQQHFNDFVFETEQKEYAAEGISWKAVDFPNNDDVLALIEGQGAGASASAQASLMASPTKSTPSTSVHKSLSMMKKKSSSTKRVGSGRALPTASDTANVGLLATIDDECLLFAAKPDSATSDAVHNDADDEAARALARRLKATFEGQRRYECTARQERSANFSVSHYAGPVEYSVVGFIAKNMDALSPDAARLLSQSTRDFVRDLEQRRSAIVSVSSAAPGAATSTPARPTLRRGNSSLATTTVSQRFRASLSSLLTEIRATRPHFIRCLKPNDANKADIFDRPRITEQLRYCGVLEAVRVARAGYPVRLPHADFVRRYRAAATVWTDAYFLRAPEFSAGGGFLGDVMTDSAEELTPQQLACNAAKTLVSAFATDAGLILEGGFTDTTAATKTPRRQAAPDNPEDEATMSNPDAGVAIGRTKIFLRKGAFEAIEALLSKRVSKACKRIQTRWRAFREANRYAAAKFFAIKLQELHRERAERSSRCATLAAATVRGWIARRRFVGVVLIARGLQRKFRGDAARAKLEWLRREKAVRRLQRLARGGAARGIFHHLRSAVISLQCFARKMAAYEARRKQYRMLRDAELAMKELYKIQEEKAVLATQTAEAVEHARKWERRYELARCDAIEERIAGKRDGRASLEAELERLKEELEVTRRSRDDAYAERDAALTALSAAIAAAGAEKRQATEAAARSSLEASRQDLEHRRILREKEEEAEKIAAEAATNSAKLLRQHAEESESEYRLLMEEKENELAAAAAEKERLMREMSVRSTSPIAANDTEELQPNPSSPPSVSSLRADETLPKRTVGSSKPLLSHSAEEEIASQKKEMAPSPDVAQPPPPPCEEDSHRNGVTETQESAPKGLGKGPSHRTTNAESRAKQPPAVQLKASQPKTSQSKSFQPKPSQAKSFQPKASQSKTSQPKAYSQSKAPLPQQTRQDTHKDSDVVEAPVEKGAPRKRATPTFEKRKSAAFREEAASTLRGQSRTVAEVKKDDTNLENRPEANEALVQRSQRQIEVLKSEVAALRRLICGGWMAQWRMLCELGEDPVPELARSVKDAGRQPDNATYRGTHQFSDGPSPASLGQALGISDYRRGPEPDKGLGVDPASLASRFAADMVALDYATAQLAGIGTAQNNPETELVDNNGRGERLPYAAALAATLLNMERSSGCLRALAAIEVNDFTPTQLRDQLDAAYARLEDMQRRLEKAPQRTSLRASQRSSSIMSNRSNSGWLGMMSCGFYKDDHPDGDI